MLHAPHPRSLETAGLAPHEGKRWRPPAGGRCNLTCLLRAGAGVQRKLLIALSLARPNPDKLLRLIATSSNAPPGIWQTAAVGAPNGRTGHSCICGLLQARCCAPEMAGRP